MKKPTITEAQINSWKREHGNVTELKVSIHDEDKHFILTEEYNHITSSLEEAERTPGTLSAVIDELKSKQQQALEALNAHEDYCVAYVRKPNLEDIDMAESIHPDNSTKKVLWIFDRCYLGGDERAKQEDDVRFSFALATNKLFKVRSVEIAKR